MRKHDPEISDIELEEAASLLDGMHHYLDDPRCCDCGCELTTEEIECDRDMCFECYCSHQD